MQPGNNGGRRREPDHITTALMKWVVFLALTALLFGGVAMALVAIWRWIF